MTLAAEKVASIKQDIYQSCLSLSFFMQQGERYLDHTLRILLENTMPRKWLLQGTLALSGHFGIQLGTCSRLLHKMLQSGDRFQAEPSESITIDFTCRDPYVSTSNHYRT